MHVFGVLYTVRKGLLIKHVNNLLLQFYRWDMSLSADCCSLASLVEAASRPPKEQLESKHLPLLHLELDHVVINIYYI